MTTPANQGGIYSVLDDERINGRSDFFAGLGEGIDGSWAPQLATFIPSSSEVENYNWLGAAPQMSVWEGEAIFGELPNYAAALRNIEYQSGLRIQKADLRRDKTGQIRTRLNGLGRRSAMHFETLLSTLMLASETDGSGTINSIRDLASQGYDGQALFDTDHSYTNSKFTDSQSNDLSGGNFNVGIAAAPTVDEMALVLRDMVTQFWTLKDDQGEPINGDARSFLIMTGTGALHTAVMGALGNDMLTSGATNPFRGFARESSISVTARLNPRLSANTTKVYMFRTDAPIRPFIIQEEVGLQVEEEDPGMTFKHINVMASATRAAGFGLWQNAMLGTLS